MTNAAVMDGTVLSTSEVLERTGLTRGQLEYLREQHPEAIIPARRIGGHYMLWHSGIVKDILSLLGSRSRAV